MPRGYRVGQHVTQPHAFTVFRAKDGTIGVRIGRQRPFITSHECAISAGYVLVTSTPDGLLIQGEGVVRNHDGVVTITA